MGTSTNRNPPQPQTTSEIFSSLMEAQHNQRQSAIVAAKVQKDQMMWLARKRTMTKEKRLLADCIDDHMVDNEEECTNYESLPNERKQKELFDRELD